MKFLSLSVAALALTLGACERHSWEDVKDEEGNVVEKGTKNLYTGHQSHEGEDHGQGEKDHGGESKADH